MRKIIENEINAINAKNKMCELRDAMSNEFFKTLEQYNLRVFKLEHLNRVEPCSSEIPILKIEIEAIFLRINTLHKEMRDRYKDLKYELEIAKGNSIILKKLNLI